jgi:hypothetical protein
MRDISDDENDNSSAADEKIIRHLNNLEFVEGNEICHVVCRASHGLLANVEGSAGNGTAFSRNVKVETSGGGNENAHDGSVTVDKNFQFNFYKKSDKDHQTVPTRNIGVGTSDDGDTKQTLLNHNSPMNAVTEENVITLVSASFSFAFCLTL